MGHKDTFEIPNADILVIVEYPYGPKLLNATDTEDCLGKVQASLFEGHKAEDLFAGILTMVKKSVGFAMVAIEPPPNPALALTYMDVWEIMVYYSLFIEHQYTYLAQRYYIVKKRRHVAFGNIVAFPLASQDASM